MALIIERLTKRFGTTEVLRGIGLEIGSGELVALLGPSGSGKTTLLRIIAGLDWPDAGAISHDGTDWLALDARTRNTGFVFQHYALFPHMTVRDNIAFGLTVRPRSRRPAKAEIAATVTDLLNFLQIAHLADRYPAALSGGQRQRVALGRAMAIGPEVLLLDEPFGALDAAVRRDLRRWLREVHEARGTTTVFVTHDQEEAFELADRVVVMGEGGLSRSARPTKSTTIPRRPSWPASSARRSNCRSRSGLGGWRLRAWMHRICRGWPIQTGLRGCSCAPVRSSRRWIRHPRSRSRPSSAPAPRSGCP
ncbi:ATP-binding cassette domain-containing protein [Haematobacter missouriensis]|uniref:sulfate/molybdate ABC transporter ATP-binding protein n=1 Tax=Haematobacter missouriensis TaxID=366616 RepID=UPI001E43B4C9|nr:ATP-binding cassette domain-containing protein [Haematobacter missouriensis]